MLVSCFRRGPHTALCTLKALSELPQRAFAAMLRQGATCEVLQDVLGHANIDGTQNIFGLIGLSLGVPSFRTEGGDPLAVAALPLLVSWPRVRAHILPSLHRPLPSSEAPLSWHRREPVSWQ